MADGERVILLTGATGVIGQAIAAELARQPGVELWLGGRDAARLDALARRLANAHPAAKLETLVFDVSAKAEVRRVADGWQRPLHVLLNNAARAPERRTLTHDGIEAQLATNVLGYVWMMEAFLPVLSASRPARVVNVASYWAGDLVLDDLEFQRRRYDNNAAYRQSKQANRMLTVAYAERFREHGVAVNACHPGDVSSRLSNELGFGGSMTAEQCAATPVWLALDDAGQRQTGKWFAHRSEARCEFSRDRAAIEDLYQRVQRY